MGMAMEGLSTPAMWHVTALGMCVCLTVMIIFKCSQKNFEVHREEGQWQWRAKYSQWYQH